MNSLINNDRFLHGVLSYSISKKTIIDEVPYVTNIKFLHRRFIYKGDTRIQARGTQVCIYI